MSYIAVIVAGGKGLRMNSEIPKQFIELYGKPVLMHTINRFADALGSNAQIILVLPEDHIPYWEKLCATHNFRTPHQKVVGGKTRFESVKNGLAACPDSGIVGVHDGVRPLISSSLVRHCFSTAEQSGSALPVTQVKQSLRMKTAHGSKAISRDGVMAVQTPQCFDLSDIREAYNQTYDEHFTDDATVYESIGHEITLVDGESTNIKITTPDDLKIAEAILASASNG